MLKIKLPDPLILYLIIAVVAAFVFPQIAYIKYNSISLKNIIDIGIFCIFFFYGIKLKWNEVFKDLLHWRLHLIIQITTFVLFPLIGLLFYPIIFIDEKFLYIFLAIFYLCSLPSTVSSSVVFVSIAKGNIVSAIFNASLSGLLGIIITPLLMSIFITTNGEIDSSSIFIDLLLKVVFPVILGALLQKWLFKFYENYKKTFTNLDKLTIVLIVYQSFSHTFSDGTLSKIGLLNIILTVIIIIFIFLFVFNLLNYLNKHWWKFNREDFITLQFCGTKKSLVHGSVMASIIFNENVGIYLLPIMFYHTFQLLFISIKSTKYAKEVD